MHWLVKWLEEGLTCTFSFVKPSVKESVTIKKGMIGLTASYAESLCFAYLERLPVTSPAGERGSVYSRSKRILFVVCFYGEPYRSPHTRMRTLLNWGKEVGRDVVNKEYMTLHWLSCDNLTKAELSPRKKRNSFFLLGSAAVLGHKRPHSGLLTLC